MPSNMTQGSQSADLTKAEREQMTKKLQQAMESGDGHRRHRLWLSSAR